MSLKTKIMWQPNDFLSKIHIQYVKLNLFQIHQPKLPFDFIECVLMCYFK